VFLSVFAGGFSLEAVREVCRPAQWSGSDVLDGVESLLDKSLLERVERSPLGSRFQIIETIREYGLEQLQRTADAHLIRERHAGYYCRLAERMEPGLEGETARSALDTLEADHDNIRESIRWCTANGSLETLLRICNGTWRFWQMRGYLTEARQRLREALELADEAQLPLTARTHLGCCELAYYQSDYGEALAEGEKALSLFESMEDREGQVLALYRLGWTHYRMDNPARAKATFHAGREVATASDDKSLLAMIEMGLGSLDWRENKTDGAKRRFAGSLAVFEECGDLKHKAEALTNLGLIAKREDKYEEAIEHYRKAAAIKEEMGEVVGLRVSYNNLGSVFLITGDHDQAESYYLMLERLARMTDDQRYLGWAHAGLAQARLAAGDTARAEADVQSCIRTAERIGDTVEMGIGYRILGDILLARDKAQEACRYFEMSIPLLQKGEDTEELRKAREGEARARSAR
jgi:tetratricopeptide (TPR) repeat protein